LLILKKPFDNVEAVQLATALTEKWHLTQQARFQMADLEGLVQERTAKLTAANSELTKALASVKELSGLVPICGYCKKIRDDHDYWHSVEQYITEHTHARFTHGICPACLAKQMREIELLTSAHELTGRSAPRGNGAAAFPKIPAKSEAIIYEKPST
jgi:hypothetical protein